MTHAREFPRYKVVDLQTLKGRIEGTKSPMQLATFSGGGCGFYCLEKNQSLSPPRRVICIFTMENVLTEALKVQGNLKYAREIVANGMNVMFYGVEFIKVHRVLVEPIRASLEELNASGKIQLAI